MQLADLLFPQPVNVHGFPAHKVDQTAQHLCRTVRVGAEMIRFFRQPDKFAAADRTRIREDIGDLCPVPLFLHAGNDLRYDVAGFPDDHRIPDPQVPVPDQVLVVQAGCRHEGAGHPYRRQHCIGRGHAGPANGEEDVIQTGLHFLRRVLVGNGIPRGLGIEAQGFLLLQAVDLDHHAVDFIGQAASFLPGLFNECPQFVHRVTHRKVHVHREPHGVHGFQGSGLCIDAMLQRILVPVQENLQVPAGCHGGVQIADGPRCRVAGIGKQRQVQGGLHFVEPLKAHLRHVDFPADLHMTGCIDIHGY